MRNSKYNKKYYMKGGAPVPLRNLVNLYIHIPESRPYLNHIFTQYAAANVLNLSFVNAIINVLNNSQPLSSNQNNYLDTIIPLTNEQQQGILSAVQPDDSQQIIPGYQLDSPIVSPEADQEAALAAAAEEARGYTTPAIPALPDDDDNNDIGNLSDLDDTTGGKKRQTKKVKKSLKYKKTKKNKRMKKKYFMKGGEGLTINFIIPFLYKYEWNDEQLNAFIGQLFQSYPQIIQSIRNGTPMPPESEENGNLRFINQQLSEQQLDQFHAILQNYTYNHPDSVQARQLLQEMNALWDPNVEGQLHDPPTVINDENNFDRESINSNLEDFEPSGGNKKLKRKKMHTKRKKGLKHKKRTKRSYK